MATMRRRDFLRAVGLGAASVALPRAACAKAGDEALPNIVLILADDLGYGDVRCLNPDSKIPTPNLDRLAEEGIRFTDSHSPSAVCSPTRYAILTGRYAWRSRLKSSVLWPWDEPLIEPDRLTMGDMLKDGGYTTACIGKWHLGWDWPTKDGSKVNDKLAIGEWNAKVRDPFGDKIDFSRPIAGGPTTRGFDYYFGDDVPNFAPYCFIENDRVLSVPSARKPEEMFGTDGPMVEGWKLEDVMPAITRKAVQFIKAEAGAAPFHKRQASPFFLYFSLTAPHTPIAPADEFEGKSEAGRYGDYVHQVDWTVGEVMRALEESGQVGNTLLIFTSDNGSPGRDGTNMAGPPNSVRKYGHNPSHIYRGIKADIWDGGHRVPFIARWPGRIPPGSVSVELIGHLDLMATFAAMTGCSLPENAAEDSYNILPALRAQKSDKPIREALVHHSVQGMFAIRQGRWKLILGRGSGGWSGRCKKGDPPGQLYDMKQDPAEKNNVYTERLEVVAQLKRLLQSYQREGRSAPRH